MDEQLSSLTESDRAAFKASRKKGMRGRSKRDGWLGRCLDDDKGRIIANLANAMIALRSDESLSSVVAFDAGRQTCGT
jgi:hypothetical protein